MIADRQLAARRKLLGILPRVVLEHLSGLERPWHASKTDLLKLSCDRWNSEEVKREIDNIFRKADKEKVL